MQALLAERFKLAAHFETQESPALLSFFENLGARGEASAASRWSALRYGATAQCDPFHVPRDNADHETYKTGSRDTTMKLIAGALPSMETWGVPS